MVCCGGTHTNTHTQKSMNANSLLSDTEHHPTSTHSVEAQVPEQRLHEDLSQVGVRVACCGAVRGVWGRCEGRARGKHLGAVSRRAVTQERGNVGVVLQAGQDDVELHPLWHKHTHFEKTAEQT